MVTAFRTRCVALWLLLMMVMQLPGLTAQAEMATDTAVKTARLSHGINITGWFRFPPSRDPAALEAYLSDPALADLRRAGFDFVRLAVDPDVVAAPPAEAVLIRSIARIERQGLSVVISPHPNAWRLETEWPRLLAFWRRLAPMLRPLDISRTLPEVVNEPVFPNDPAAWAAAQHAVLGVIRAALPAATVVLTGQDWGSIKGLLALTPEDDDNVLYSFHFYDPAELTSLAAYRPDLDRAALARLPFPADDASACRAAAPAMDAPTRDLIAYYCAFGWGEARVRQTIETAASWARVHHVRLLAGEFGASAALNPPARVAWLRAVEKAFATDDIAWALWGYDDVMGLAVTRPPPARPGLDRKVLSALGLVAFGTTPLGLGASGHASTGTTATGTAPIGTALIGTAPIGTAPIGRARAAPARATLGRTAP
jgi:endoglucanase